MMELSDVPAAWFAFRCGACGEYVGVPPDQTVQERVDAIAAHRLLCRSRPYDQSNEGGGA